MKKFTKIMLSVAAVTAVSTAMAISAMAADTVTGTYDNATGTVTLDGVVSSGDQQTLLVLTEDAATVTESIIAQIDQDASISQFVLPTGLVGEDKDEVTYYIRIGGTDGTIQTGTLVLNQSGGGGGDVSTVAMTIGDVNGDNEVGAGDGLFVARYNAKYTTNIGQVGTQYDTADNSVYTVGDVNGDNEVGAGDGLFIARYNAKYTTNIGSVGQTINVVAAE